MEMDTCVSGVYVGHTGVCVCVCMRVCVCVIEERESYLLMICEAKSGDAIGR